MFPRVTGRPALPYNRLAAFWRPLFDLTDSEVAPLRLRMIRPVAAWLADPASAAWPWFSRIGLPGLRRQVVRHAGLDRYDCHDPRDLPEELRTPGWTTLAETVDRFAELDHRARTLVVVQLTQLSYHPLALKLAGAVRPDGDPERDRYVYEVARVHAGCPGHAARALALFEDLATSSGGGPVALAACFQGIGHAIRDANDLARARRFEERGHDLAKPPDDWHSCLVGSRFHRAVALLRLKEGDTGAARRALAVAARLHDDLAVSPPTDADEMIVRENRRYLLELELAAETRGVPGPRTRSLCRELLRLDPYCVHARLLAGDGFAAAGDHAEAALWYSRAGELGTGAGATGWFRAAQCHDLLGDRAGAVNAMGRCLELDATAVEARDYLTG
ncbi:hypothetical protein [Actinomadura sp. DC4]|uniref:hypothetical protein n=1 Tax=Actinomadura sp. DC4 TaxID=3055069 RepID=UPI0025AF08EB|nr:hypothetical protein [Actinomadura sp. DC4]MDN3354458.1 hypothetical protein [Actinomadura sp. DC4]